MRNKSKSKMAKLMAATLKKVLVVEANTTSCALLHQPKTPKELDKFRKVR